MSPEDKTNLELISSIGESIFRIFIDNEGSIKDNSIKYVDFLKGHELNTALRRKHS